MYDVPVFFATSEGQTQRIAEAIAQSLRAAGLGSVALDVASGSAAAFDWSTARGAVLAASLHVGRHQRSATGFAHRHLPQLARVPTLFVSVSLSAASQNPEERRAAQRLAEEFGTAIGWTPSRIACVAGALTYTRYSFLTRWFMKRIARKEGGPTDTTRDHELTDWGALAQVATEFAGHVRGVAAAPV